MKNDNSRNNFVDDDSKSNHDTKSGDLVKAVQVLSNQSTGPEEKKKADKVLKKNAQQARDAERF